MTKSKEFLIELSGDATGCAVVPTCCLKYCSIKGGGYCIDMNIIASLGFKGFTMITGGHNINIPHVTFGTETCVQLEKPYPWTKHNLVSNVPIQAFCKNGWFNSICHYIAVKFKEMIKLN